MSRLRRDAQVIGRLLPFFRPHAGRFVLVTICTMLVSAAEGGQTLLLEPLLNRVLLQGSDGDAEEADREWVAARRPRHEAALAVAELRWMRRELELMPADGVDPLRDLGVVYRRGAGADPDGRAFAVLDRTRRVLIDAARALEGSGEDPGSRPRLVRAVLIQQEAVDLLRRAPDDPGARTAAAALSLEARESARRASFDSAWDTLRWIFVAALGLAAVLGVARYLTNLISREIVARVYTDQQNAVVMSVLALSPGQLKATRRGDLLSRLTTDLAQTTNGVVLPLASVLLIQPVRLAVLIALAFAVSWRLSLVLIVGSAAILWPIRWWGKFIRRFAERRQGALGDVLEAMHQMFAGVRLVKAYRREEHERRRFRDITSRAYEAELGAVRARTASRTWIHLVNDLTIPAMVLGGGYLVVRHLWGMDAGKFATFTALIVFMYRPAKAMAVAYNTLQDSLPSLRRVLEVFDLRPEVSDAPGARPIERVREGIRVERVSFSYDGDKPVLEDVSLEAPVGTTTAFVGHTGSGKTTLLDLIARFMDPQQGEVLVDGVPLRTIELASYRARTAMVSQDVFLFNDTVRENIRYGRLDASDAEIEEAARAARVHDEILALPGGYDYVVGEQGSKLSGGQVQRITIARAIIRNPDVLFLDEAMSALDARTERLVQDALDELGRGRTTFAIAHRLSTVRHADQIVVLDGGRIVERGRHEELLALGGRYAELVLHLAQGREEPASAPPPAPPPVDPPAEDVDDDASLV